MNLKNIFYDLLQRNYLKEFVKGFFGIKDEKICNEKLDLLFTQTNYSP